MTRSSEFFHTSQSFQSFLFVFQTLFFLGHRLLVDGRRRNDARLLGRRRRVFRRRRRLVGARLRLGVDLGENFGSGAVVVVTLEQQLSGLLVQRRLRIGDDQETLDGEQNVLQTLKKSQHMLEAFGI